MSLTGSYDDDNIFAKIIRGEIPSVKIFEDDEVLAFMDAFPQAKGHCLVVSKVSKARNLLEIEPEVLSTVMTAVQKLARGAVAALKPDGVVITQFNGAPAGQTVFHLHVHVIPRWEGEALGRHGGGMADMDELKTLAGQIRAAIEG
jgi:histidine triad (HIT) family protein